MAYYCGVNHCLWLQLLVPINFLALPNAVEEVDRARHRVRSLSTAMVPVFCIIFHRQCSNQAWQASKVRKRCYQQHELALQQ